MSKSKVYPGLSGWACFRPGSHNWLDDHSRTFLNLTWTTSKGKRRYQSLFLNTEFADGTPNPDVQMSEDDEWVTLRIAKKPKVKLFSVSGKDMFD